VSYLVELPVADGAAPIRVELREPADGLVRAARPGRVVARASQSLTDMLAAVKPVAEAFVDRFRGLADAPDEIRVDFGVTLSAEADLVIASTATEANFAVSLTWKRQSGADVAPGVPPGRICD